MQTATGPARAVQKWQEHQTPCCLRPRWTPETVLRHRWQVSDHKGAAAMFSSRLAPIRLLADRRHRRMRNGSATHWRIGNSTVHPARETSQVFDKRRYKRRRRIVGIFDGLMDWRGVEPRFVHRSEGLPIRHRSRGDLLFLTTCPGHRWHSSGKQLPGLLLDHIDQRKSPPPVFIFRRPLRCRGRTRPAANLDCEAIWCAWTNSSCNGGERQASECRRSNLLDSCGEPRTNLMNQRHLGRGAGGFRRRWHGLPSPPFC